MIRPPIVLMYHQISDLSDALDPYRISVSPLDFEKQMAYLSRDDFHVMKLSDAVVRLKQGVALPPNAVCLTFDDGYLDNYTTAYPILQKYNLPATIYLVSGYMGQSAGWDGEIGRQLPLMTWDHAREMLASGLIEFGGHTHTHTALDTADEKTIADQVNTCKQEIEAALGITVKTLAYPYERFNQQVQDITASAGYTAACGSARMQESMFNLWRVEIGKDEQDFTRFQHKVSLTWKRITQIKRVIRRVLP